METQPSPRTAPFYTIPPRRIVSVEHPAVVKDVDKAIDTLYGDTGISQILHPPKADTSINLMLRPEDVMSRPMRSTSSGSNNVLLKVTVPKRTGRKRKRGSDDPFTQPTPAESPERPAARDILRSLRDNVGRYHIEPVGLVQRTHVFRGMPDYVFSTTASPFANRFRDQILSFDLDKMKQFDMDMTKGATSNVDLIPPPSFSRGDVPFTYMYRQNPSVKHSTDPTGKTTTVNVQTPNKVLTHLLKYDDPSPTHPRACPPIDTLEKPVQEALAIIQPLFERQPIWTRRGLRCYLKNAEHRHALRYAVPYVGYIFRSGPWRDAIVKFGHDPRSSPDYRIYQTFMFKLAPREPELARDGGSGRRHNVPRINPDTVPDPTGEDTQPVAEDAYIFTGAPPLHRDGRIWMATDIHDPLLRSILFPEHPGGGFLREKCDYISDGWYGNGTLAKVKTIMRYKIQTLAEGRTPDDGDYLKLLTFPNHAADEDEVGRLFSFDPQTVSNRDLLLATEVRAAIKGAPNWRGMRREKREGEKKFESEGEGEEELEERELMGEGAVES